MDVFISYKREEIDYARAIAERLSAEGFSVWWDMELVPGDKFSDVIAAFLEEARATVVLWSKLAVQSDFVRSEAHRANSLKTYIPVSIDGTSAPLGLDVQHCLTLDDWDGSADAAILDPLVSAVSRRIGARRKSLSREQQLADAAEIELWRAIARNRSPEQLQYYLERYGAEGLFAELAEFHLRAEPPIEAAPSKSPPSSGSLVLIAPPKFSHASIALEIEGVIAAATLLPDNRLLICQSTPKAEEIKKRSGPKPWEDVLLVDLKSSKVTPAFAVVGGATGIGLSPDGRFAVAIAKKLGNSLIVDLETMRGRPIGDDRHQQDCSNYPAAVIWESETSFIAYDDWDAYRVTLDRYAGIASATEIFDPPFTALKESRVLVLADGRTLSLVPFGSDAPPGKTEVADLADNCAIESLHASPDEKRILIGVDRSGRSSIHIAEIASAWPISASRQSKAEFITCTPSTFSWIDKDLIASCWEGKFEIIFADNLRSIYAYPDERIDSIISATINGRTTIVGWYTDEIHVFTES